jgi:sulfite exporter TauE/SafE
LTGIYFSQKQVYIGKGQSRSFMSWYIVFAGLYLVSLALVLAFFAGATKLNEQAEANSRAKLKMMPRGISTYSRERHRYRDAA